MLSREPEAGAASNDAHGRPLAGRRIVVTRPVAQASALSDRLEAHGATVIVLPVSRIEQLDPQPLREALARLAEYDWAAFTSRNAVRVVCDELARIGHSPLSLGSLRLAAVGPATADALRGEGLEVAVMPRRFDAEGVVEAMRDQNVAGAHVLYVTAEGARDVLAAGLEAQGASVDVVRAYRSVPQDSDVEPLTARLRAKEIDLVTFTAPSTVHAYVEALGEELATRAPAASIGPVTSEAVQAAGIPLGVEAAEATIESLVAAVVDWVYRSAR
jgi:uroporphyrinogen-III synthase